MLHTHGVLYNPGIYRGAELTSASAMADKFSQVDALLLKSLLGEDIIDIKFYIFSSRSKLKGKLVRPRILHANTKILSESSSRFSDREFLPGTYRNSNPEYEFHFSAKRERTIG